MRAEKGPWGLASRRSREALERAALGEMGNPKPQWT